MALVSFQFTVKCDPVEIFPNDPDGANLVIQISKLESENAYLGGAGVTVDNGFLITTTDPPLYLTVGPNEPLYAVAKESVTVYVLATMNM